MKRHYYYPGFLLLIFLSFHTNSFASGLKFNGSERLIDERTSYDVFGNKSPLFSEKLDISFDISLLEPSHFGYIVRIKNNEADKTYNLSYYIDGSFTLFKFNKEGGKNLITVKLSNEKLQKLNWFRVSIVFDSKNHTLSLSLNNLLFKVNDIHLPQEWRPDICFGRSEYLIDVPSFAIKELSVSDNSHTYTFLLKESKGNEAHNNKGESFGHISNPVWLINDAYYWSYKKIFKSARIAGCNFDTKTDNLYIFNRDSLITYNVRTGNKISEAFQEKCPVDIFSGTNFLDSDAKKLYVYEVCNEKKEKGPNVAVLDLKTKQWSIASYASVYMQLHHHSASFDPGNKRYYIFGGFGGFGGFGNMQYSKSLFSYNFSTNKWDSLLLTGDKINPRYFSSMGYRKENNSLYIFGGMGNESGEQVVGRRYFYDLHKINLNDNSVTKLWELSWNKENVVPVRELIIPNDNSFYTLCYPEHFSKTFLKLYRFSIKDGSYKILGDSIPIRSEKIKTKANIYYSSNMNCLFAVIQEFDNFDISSVIKVYSLTFPPISYEELTLQETKADSNRLIIILILTFLLLGVSTLFILVRRKKKKLQEEQEKVFLNTDENNSEQTSQIQHIAPRPNSIYLFGQFRVIDRKNKDITYMFSSKLKQTFLTILQYSLLEGISSQELSELLWPDKPEDKVKNSRGVTINHLRKIMKELDGIELIYEKGLFKIIILPALCHCDYIRCIEMINANTVEQNSSEFIDIIRQGKFLKSIDLPEFDSFKENMEKILEPALLMNAEKCFLNEEYSQTIILCDALFYIDPINEDAVYYSIHALTKLRQINEAQKRYFLFVKEYKKMMGKEYPVSFSDFSVEKRRTTKK
ncbi:MAG: hypothetical protein PHT07_15675 [Paludibacter sp.]|nr:hypothetical protein [Paludibacter sp.]